MPGLSDTAATAVLNGLTAQTATAWPADLYVALFTAVGKDDGTGFTEVSGGSYARVHINTKFSAPGGGEPGTVTNGSSITFPTATAGWGDVLAWGLYDAATVGNLWAWDYLGNYPWLPVYISAANPAVWTVKDHGYFSQDNFVYSNEYGGTLMTMTAGSFSLTGDGSTGVSPILLVEPPGSTDTFTANNTTTAIAASTSGSGMVRKVIVQTIPINGVVSIAAGQLTLLAA